MEINIKYGVDGITYKSELILDIRDVKDKSDYKLTSLYSVSLSLIKNGKKNSCAN